MQRIREKLWMACEEIAEKDPITIVAFGDSVTHGWLRQDLNYETVYWNRLRQKINAIRDVVPVNVINAGIGGITAKDSLQRMDRQVLAHHPDLIIVCFGLNDVNGTLDDYLSSLRTIFEKGLSSGAAVIFMTPNMLNTYVSPETQPHEMDYAAITAEYQNSGRMDRYMDAAVSLAHEMNVPVCDCYAQWKKLSETQDTTLLLVNRINHPTVEMHELFAESLFQMIFPESDA